MNKIIKALLNELKHKLIWKGLKVGYADTQPTNQVPNGGAPQQVASPLAQTTQPVQPVQPVQPSTQPGAAYNNPVSPTQPVQTAQPTLNFDDLIAKARQEEKGKLYPEITRLKTELDEKTKRVNELLISNAEKDKEIEGLKAEGSKTKSSKVVELEREIEKLKGELKLKDGEVAQVKLNAYKEMKINQAGGELIPELVVGNTIEEIDASLENSKARYKQIAANFAQSTPQSSANLGVQQGTPLVNPTTTYVPPVASPSVPSGGTNIDMSNIDLFTPEGRSAYEQLRKTFNLK